MDVLSDVLSAIRLSGAIFFDNTFHDPWVVETPRASVIASKVMPHSQYVFSFHTLLEGSCWAEMIDGSAEPMRLEAMFNFIDKSNVGCAGVMLESRDE